MPERAKTVVVVDDDAAMGRAVTRLLKAAGYETLSFCSGESFLAAFTSADCFVLDIHMPGMSGFELAERLKTLDVRTPVFFITARDDTLSRERARKLDAVGFLRKPFDGEALLALVARCLEPARPPSGAGASPG